MGAGGGRKLVELHLLLSGFSFCTSPSFLINSFFCVTDFSHFFALRASNFLHFGPSWTRITSHICLLQNSP